jgi:hypothetical protein
MAKTPERAAQEREAQLKRFGKPVDSTDPTPNAGALSGVRNSGISTSDSASKNVSNARDTLNGIQNGLDSSVASGEISSSGGSSNNGTRDQLSTLFQQLSDMRGKLTTAKENERLAKENLDDVDLNNKLGNQGSAEEGGDNAPTDLSRSIEAINAGDNADTSKIEDPVMAATTQATLNKLSLIEQQITRSNDFAQTMSEYSQADINDINSTAMRAVEREIAENARVQRSMEFAGIIGGRAQMAPRVEGTLIHEIVKDGLDRINVINDKKDSAIRQARKAETEFNYALFTDSVDLAKEYYEEIEDSVTSLKAEVRLAEKDEQDKITFRQQQEDRNSVILAPELYGETKDMTPEEQQAYLSKVSVANDIPLGSLLREVRDYTPEPEKVVAGSGSNTIIGGFNKADSATLAANGLENADVADQRLFIAGGVQDRKDILEKYAEGGPGTAVATIDEVDTLIREKMDFFGTLGSDFQDDALYKQADKFGHANDKRGAQGDVRAFLRDPAVSEFVKFLLKDGKTAEEVLIILADEDEMDVVHKNSRAGK